jgi:glycine amidinotransferase
MLSVEPVEPEAVRAKHLSVVPSAPEGLPIVNSYTEWDPLEEVIVGDIDGAHVPEWHVAVEATMPDGQASLFQQNGGRPFPAERVAAARRELEEFAHILRSEGVIVRTPDPKSYGKPFSTPDWSSPGGLYSAMPRDIMLVIGDELIEAPLSWRSRYFEIHAFRPILRDYFRQGARWTAVPRPELRDELYADSEDLDKGAFAVGELEPTFDAADFTRCGKDIFVQQSHVTNKFGIEWLRRHLGGRFRVHELQFNDDAPMHIDATFVPLAPGKLLVNPERVGELPLMFKNWDILKAPRPTVPDDHPLFMSSKWLTMNILMLDEKRVMVEKHEEPMIKAMRSWGFEPILCPFRNFYSFGGSFHCATLDVRRRGSLQSYF